MGARTKTAGKKKDQSQLLAISILFLRPLWQGLKALPLTGPVKINGRRLDYVLSIPLPATGWRFRVTYCSLLWLPNAALCAGRSPPKAAFAAKSTIISIFAYLPYSSKLGWILLKALEKHRLNNSKHHSSDSKHNSNYSKHHLNHSKHHSNYSKHHPNHSKHHTNHSKHNFYEYFSVFRLFRHVVNGFSGIYPASWRFFDNTCCDSLLVWASQAEIR